MRLHFMGEYNLNPESLPHGEHMPNARPFREAQTTKEMAVIGNIGAMVLMFLLTIFAYFRCRGNCSIRELLLPMVLAGTAFVLILFPHEFLHAICFKKDAYLYTNWKQGILFVVGPETMSKSRFVFLSLLPNALVGLIPYTLGMIFPQALFLTIFGVLCLGAGFGDYYNIFNALTQMPKGARTYMYQFNSYWYLPEDKTQ